MTVMTATASSQSDRAAAPLAPGTVRVLLCDDSALVRAALQRHLHTDPLIRVVAKAANGQAAIDAVRAGGIDVVVLDIEMPVMDGMTALPQLLRLDPAIRVLMSSTLTTQGAAIALESLRLGAADFIPKPTASGGTGLDAGFREELIAKVAGLGRQAHRQRAQSGQRNQSSPAPSLNTPALSLRPAAHQRPHVLAIGSSTGGPAALLALFRALGDRVAVPMLLTQHMPASFTPQLAEHIQRLGGATCAEAVHGEKLRPGHVHLAPGNRHLTVTGRDAGATVAVTDDAPENFCRPAVDPMLRSLAVAFPGRVLVVMLTGMGQDGLIGANQVIQGGGGVIAQDEASSVVWGMPGAVARAGLCQAVLPLSDLAPAILALVGRRAA